MSSSRRTSTFKVPFGPSLANQSIVPLCPVITLLEYEAHLVPVTQFSQLSMLQLRDEALSPLMLHPPHAASCPAPS